MSGGGAHEPGGGPPEDEPERDAAHILALAVMVIAPLLLAGLVYGVLKALSG